MAVVVIAYNRLSSLQRLIHSLCKASYLGDKVDLVISLDHCGQDSLIRFADSVLWPYGAKRVIAHKTRLGLKSHVLKCGDLTKEYNSICVFEDDLFASPGFYAFAKQASQHFIEWDLVAGISLYSHQWNPYVDRPFGAIEDRFDVFFLQVAQSWGQVWNRRSWQDFVEWMREKTDETLVTPLLPAEVSNWSSRSWLKFHNRYLIDVGKYFVYPRQSLSTNFSEQGEHAGSTATYQVPLLLDVKDRYYFPDSPNALVKYNAFFENISIPDFLGVDKTMVDVSLYGNCITGKRYLLTTDALNYKVIKSYGLLLRPIDANVVLDIPGTGIYLYDTSKPERNEASGLMSDSPRFLYEIRAGSWRAFLKASALLLARALLRRARM
jgi:hypothetical protein